MKQNLIGHQFHCLTVIAESRVDKHGQYWWTCRCSCGVERVASSSALRRGVCRSCGCQHKKGHGHTRGGKSRTYVIWQDMRRRCEKPNCNAWPRYGGRGIIVCERWMKFENFLADMGEAPSDREIDRKDNDGNYEPGNCRWADQIEQARNTSAVILTPEIANRIRALRVETGWGSRRIAAALGTTERAVAGVLYQGHWAPHVSDAKARARAALGLPMVKEEG